MDNKESKNKEYLNSLLNEQPTISNPVDDSPNTPQQVKNTYQNNDSTVLDIEYTFININILPSARYYKQGTKIAIRSAKVAEIQAYSMVDDNNIIEITEKMNSLLSRNIRYIHADGSEGTYKNVFDGDRMFLLFMIREITFQGGNTLTKEHQCECGHDLIIPFRTTPGPTGPATFEVHEPNELIEEFYNTHEHAYEIIDEGVSWLLSPPTIGIQEDFFEELRRNSVAGKKPNIAFMKIMPYMLHGKSTITEDEIKEKLKDFINMDDIELFQVFNELVDNMKTGIKGLKMKCSECGVEVHTDLTFPGGASTLFKYNNILGRFRRKN